MASQAQFGSDYGSTADEAVRAYCNRATAYSTGVSDARKGLSRKEDFAEICRVNRAELNEAYNSGYSFGLTNQSGLIINEPAPYHPAIQAQLPAAQTQPYTRLVEVPGYGNQGQGQGEGSTGGSAYGPPGATGPGRASSTVMYPGEQMVPSGDFARPQPEHGLQSLIEIRPSRRPKCIQTTSGQACGFNCVNSLNNVRCAASPDQYCRSNDNGDIACGYNCIASSKTVRCAAFPTDSCISDHNGYVFCGQNCRIDGNAMGVCDIERYAP